MVSPGKGGEAGVQWDSSASEAGEHQQQDGAQHHVHTMLFLGSIPFACD